VTGVGYAQFGRQGDQRSAVVDRINRAEGFGFEREYISGVNAQIAGTILGQRTAGARCRGETQGFKECLHRDGREFEGL